MEEYQATELAYNNGYSDGYSEGYAAAKAEFEMAQKCRADEIKEIAERWLNDD